MTGGKIEYHTKVVFTLKALSDASSITVSVSNIPEYTITDEVWPILKQVGSVGSQMGEFLPTTGTSSITLKNGPSSLGFERRFSDLLERYSIINQQVLVYVAASAIGSFTSADYELRWAGTVKRHRMRGSEFIVEIAGRGIQDRIINTMVSAETFPYAPAGSLGYALPVIIGDNVQVRPVLTNSSSASSVEWAYGTNLVDFRCGGLAKAYAKAHDGTFAEVQSAASTTTALYGTPYVAGVSPYGTTTPYYEWDYAERFTAGSAGYVITGASYWVNKLAGAADGYIDLSIAVDDLIQNGSSANWGRAPGTILGTGRYELSLLSASAGNYEIRVNFGKPIVIKPYQSWFFCHKKSGETTGKMQYLFNGAGSNSYFYKNTSLWLEATGDDPFWCLYGLQIYNTPPTGISRHAGITTDQNTAISNKPDISAIDWIFEVDGLKDDSLGTVTGSASSLIESPQHAVELLTKQFNGTIYTGGQFGTEHSSTWTQVNSSASRFFRKLKGKTAGQVKLSQFLEQICRDSASRITMHPSTSTPLGYWAWGATADVSDYLGPDEFEFLEHEVAGTETIVNSLEIFYDERLTSLDYVTGSALGEFKNYAGRFSSTDTTAAGYAEANAVSSVSSSIYGAMTIETRARQWIGDSTSAQNVGISILRRYAVPSHFIDIEVPYLRFKDRKMLDVVHITSPELPAFFGTTPKASKPVYATTGAEVDISTGLNLMRASGVRAQVEGLTTIFDSENTPRIRATLRLLNNTKDVT